MNGRPGTNGQSRIERRIARFSRLAALALGIEAAAAAFWPVPTVIAGFLVLALLGLPQALPPLLHAALIAAVAGLVVYLIVAGRRRLVPTAPDAAIRRVERDSGLSHRPFETLADRPAGEPGQAMLALWRIHQERQRTRIGKLRLAAPQPGLPARDPWALRLLVCVLLVLSLLVAGPRAGQRIAAAFAPNFAGSATPVPVEAWIRPPAYTGLAPILLKPGQDQAVAVPVGSLLEAHVTDGKRLPRLIEGDARVDFKPVDGGGFSLQTPLTRAGTLSIRRGWSTLAAWPISIIPDNPPVVAFVNRPTAMQSGALRVEYRATDDYGVAAVNLKIRLAPGHGDIAGDPIDVALTSGQNAKELHASSFQDLTAHPWAGMAVLARLVATDTDGQPGESDEVPLILPERVFLNPAAQAIVGARKHVILGDESPYRVSQEVANIADHPELFGGDYAVFLALRAATDELRRQPQLSEGAVETIEDLLWNAALKIEDGNRPEAEKALRNAEDALEKALKDPSTPASEIARLTRNLKEAMNRDIDAMIENMRKQQAATGDQAQPQTDPSAQVMDRGDLDKQVDKMSEMAQDGSRDAAQEMLDYIKSLLENMRAGQQPGKANAQGEKSLKELKDLAKKQRDMENGSDPNAAQEQEALRQSLGNAAKDVGDAMGNIPQSMGAADKAMRNAAKALQRGAKGSAKGEQEDAAQQLDDAAKSLSDQLSQQGSGTELKGDGNGDRDPLGRARFDKGNSVKVPTDREMQRSRAILDELRHRAGERERPRLELDYLKRLLQQY
jgi:uncharacterized protein (TIGR02302 family)